ncbi:MAG: CPBP family intramembrane metalloprotease [Saprospiraceae bacterium]|nr:CPBP family intramembrane metalloprotease [Saprospiraceae bacterium]MCB0675271.1 CPBP family intramembrane metalloprotease [Saprospiraceae bacterium]
MTEPGTLDHLAAILLGIILPYASLKRGQLTMGDRPLESQLKVVFYRINSLFQWILTAAVLAIWLYRDRTLGSLGLQWPRWEPSTTVFTLTLGFVLAYSVDTYRQVATPAARERTRRQWRERTPFMPASPREFRHFLLVALTAGFCEELLFRGFLINYLAWYLEPTPTGLVLSITLPALVFSLVHIYQGWEAVAKIALLAVIFGGLFVLTGSLLIPIVLHLAVDAFGGYLGYRILFDGREHDEGMDEEEE